MFKKNQGYNYFAGNLIILTTSSFGILKVNCHPIATIAKYVPQPENVHISRT